MTVLFISDLHLTPERPDIARAFSHFMKHRAPFADALYILGDFFEYWVGDDAMESFHQEVASLLKDYTDSGKALFMMPGNRDFAIGKQFLKLTGAQWLKDPSLIDLNGEQVLLMHGDLLCTHDTEYLKYRKRVRNPLVLGLLRRTPLSYRRNLAKKIRANSKKAKAGKAMSIMDVTPEEVIRVMDKFGVKTLIHGHTHRPAVHDLQLTSGSGKRYVLGDWDRSGWELLADGKQLCLSEFDL